MINSLTNNTQTRLDSSQEMIRVHIGNPKENSVVDTSTPFVDNLSIINLHSDFTWRDVIFVTSTNFLHSHGRCTDREIRVSV